MITTLAKISLRDHCDFNTIQFCGFEALLGKIHLQLNVKETTKLKTDQSKLYQCLHCQKRSSKTMQKQKERQLLYKKKKQKKERSIAYYESIRITRANQHTVH